jgi:hypothetical protein
MEGLLAVTDSARTAKKLSFERARRVRHAVGRGRSSSSVCSHDAAREATAAASRPVLALGATILILSLSRSESR